MREQNEEYARPAQPPDTSSLATMREAAAHCTACHLYKRATQTVFGEGPKRAAMMLIGEQPGDYEDVAGKPFVGPAGKIMDRALADAGIDRSQVYVSNAVKHFKWEPRGKRRIHQKPNSREIAACRPWLEAELRIVKPNLVVAMGATAAQAIFGPGFRVTRERGKVLSSKLAPRVLATVHPSSLLRQPDEKSREREYKHFVADLRAAVRAAGEEQPALSCRAKSRHPATLPESSATGFLDSARNDDLLDALIRRCPLYLVSYILQRMLCGTDRMSRLQFLCALASSDSNRSADCAA